MKWHDSTDIKSCENNLPNKYYLNESDAKVEILPANITGKKIN